MRGSEISGVGCRCMVNTVCVDAVWCIKVKTKELELTAASVCKEREGDTANQQPTPDPTGKHQQGSPHYKSILLSCCLRIDKDTGARIRDPPCYHRIQ